MSHNVNSQINEEGEDDWFSFKEKKLGNQYGGRFIRVKAVEHGHDGIVYICQLCRAECNTKKALDSHCSGMKHLKNKNKWEKEGKPQVLFDDYEKTGGKKDDTRNRSASPFEKSQSSSKRKLHESFMSDKRKSVHSSSKEYFIHDNYGGFDDFVGSSKRNEGDKYDPFEDHASPNTSSRNIDLPPLRGNSSEDEKLPLMGSPAGTLLQKLGEGSIKSKEDYDIASNVSVALIKSLKEYNKNSNSKIELLLKEAELKVYTAKTLKVGMNLTSLLTDTYSN